jgi:ribulose-phosphate 3-epimerase
LGEKVFLDCHLMIENPELWVERFHRSGASSITFHFESTKDAVALASRIKSFSRCGVAVKPDTDISQLSDELLGLVDMVLVMTVEPGFGGQKLIGACVNKISELRLARKFDKLIQVDGGVDESNFGELAAAGANVLVAGSSIFKKYPNFKSIISLLKE